MRSNRLHSQYIAVPTEAGDRANCDWCDNADLAPRLARRGVAQVHLEDGPIECRQRIADAPGVMGERAGINNDRRAPSTSAVNSGYQL